MKHDLMDILACPICECFPLELKVFNEDDEINSGILICSKCLHWYPIQDKIPQMLPDKMREKEVELNFLTNWISVIPNKILMKGKPFNLKSKIKNHTIEN